MLRFFDHHAHLQDEAFAADVEAVIARAQAAGVERIVLSSSSIEDSRQAIDLALGHPGLFVAAGCHPHEAKDFAAQGGVEALRQLILESNARAAAAGRLPVVVAVGEIGLDYYYDHSPRDIQAEVYKAQIELAHELGLPFVIHEREAYQDNLTILQAAAAKGLLLPELPAVCHCYSGSPEGAEALLKLGLMLGFDGPLTYKNARKAPDVVKAMPFDRLLIETDSPYLTPVPFRGQRNESLKVILVALEVAQLLGLTLADVAEQTWQNACRLYRLPL